MAWRIDTVICDSWSPLRISSIVPNTLLVEFCNPFITLQSSYCHKSVISPDSIAIWDFCNHHRIKVLPVIFPVNSTPMGYLKVPEIMFLRCIPMFRIFVANQRSTWLSEEILRFNSFKSWKSWIARLNSCFAYLIGWSLKHKGLHWNKISHLLVFWFSQTCQREDPITNSV